MKTFKRIIALIMAVVLMAGCTMKTNAGFKIAEDGKVSITMIMAMDNEMIDAFLTMQEMDESEMQNIEDPDDVQVKEHTDAERWAFIESDSEDSPFAESDDDMEGFTKAKYDQNGMKGYVYTKEVGTLDQVTKESATDRVDVSDAIEGESFADKVLFTKKDDVYKSNMKLVADSEEMNSQSMEEIKEYGGQLDVSFIVELPTKAISSNADSTENDGKTLKWDLYTSKNLEFEFKLKDAKEETAAAEDSKKDKKSSTSTTEEDSNLMLYVGIGAGVLVLLVIVVVAVVASSKKKKAQAAAAAQPSVMAPTYGPTVQPLEPPVQPVQPVQPEQPAQPVDPQDPNNNQQM
jgi:hypothetical protein